MITPDDDQVVLKKSELAFAIELARGASISQAAQTVGVSEPTGYRWAKKPAIGRHVEEIRAEVLQTAARKLSSVTAKAVEKLDKLLDSPDERIQLAAARNVLDGACKLRQLADLDKELRAIHLILLDLEARRSRRRTA